MFVDFQSFSNEKLFDGKRKVIKNKRLPPVEIGIQEPNTERK